MICEQKYLR